MKIHTYFAALAVLAGGAYAVIAPTQAPEPEEPTAQHEALMEGVGTFTGTMKMLMPGMEMEMPCTEEVTAFGDFWVVTDFTCSMGPDAVYHGRGTMGYDPRTKEAIGTWIDTTTSHMSMMRGTNDLEKGVTTMDFEMPVETMRCGMILPPIVSDRKSVV